MLIMAAVVGAVTAWLAGVVAHRAHTRGLAVPYTRKLFHICVFTSAAIVHGQWGIWGTNAFGTIVAARVLLACARGDADPLYMSLARGTDRPRRTLFIVAPMVATLVGGLASALAFGPYAAVGYLVSGWGDAAGEPVGTRWGRHKYAVPSLVGVPAQRTLEGSAAVLLVGWLGATVALWPLVGVQEALVVGIVCGTVGAVAEAFSNHGLDNLTVQVAASGTAWLLLT